MILDERLFIVLILAFALAGFVWGRFRHDIVAVAALCIAVIGGLVPAGDAFGGFGHPATVTVAAVLVLSRALVVSGAVDIIVTRLLPETERIDFRIAGIGSLAAALSAMINNVGALALMMPAAIQSAIRARQSPALILMPLSFASILGGLITMIGTPPNVIVATFRGDALGSPFGMFDFTPVGAAVAVAGVLFVSFVGWRLLPKSARERYVTEELFEVGDYVTETLVTEESKANGQTLADLESEAAEAEILVIGVVRGARQIRVSPRETLRVGDRLLIEGSSESLDKFVGRLELKIAGTKNELGDVLGRDKGLVEAVVAPRSPIENRTVGALRLPSRYGINLLAVSRQGKPLRGRLTRLQLNSGDVLLLQGEIDRMPEALSALGCLPLAERGIHFGRSRQAGLALGIFAAAVAAAAFNIVAMPIALLMAVLAVVGFGLLPPREIYSGIDWPVIVLLGAMIPLGGALESTGTTAFIAQSIVDLSGSLPAFAILTLVLVVTMTLSDVLNNAATAVIMSPIALAIANILGVNGDAFLMAVAVGASCAFLTPIGHQNNTLVMGPGGYSFGDYWRMGLPLEIVVTAVAVPLILLVWPI